jgi:hypothetical protein
MLSKTVLVCYTIHLNNRGGIKVKLAHILKIERIVEEQITLCEEIERDSFEQSEKDDLCVDKTDNIDKLYQKLENLHQDLVEIKLLKRRANEKIEFDAPANTDLKEESLEYAVAYFQELKRIQKVCSKLANAKQRERVSRNFPDTFHYKYATYNVKKFRDMSEKNKKLLFVLDSEIQSRNWAVDIELPENLKKYDMKL